jgi:hypothetical protein
MIAPWARMSLSELVRYSAAVSRQLVSMIGILADLGTAGRGTASSLANPAKAALT